MKRYNFYSAKITNGYAIIDGEEKEHLTKVLRLTSGTPICIFNGKGAKYLANIEKVDKEFVRCIIDKEVYIKAFTLEITLAQSVVKKPSMESIVKKCTELGVNSIIPMVTERSVVKSVNINRLFKISKEAAKQSGFCYIPDIYSIHTFNEVLEKAKKYDLKLMFMPFLSTDECLTSTEKIKIANDFSKNDSTKKGYNKLRDLLINKVKYRNAIVFIGPEGGFSPSEIEYAQSNNVHFASLGRNTLRADTAAICAVNILRYEFNFE